MLELCVEDAESLRGAVAAGADRLEVCAGLDLDGLTPGPGLLVDAAEVAREAPGAVDLAVMVRPRHHPAFLTATGERGAMLRDLEHLRSLAPVEAFVFGVLDGRGRLDRPFLAELVAAARPARAVLHRAFDRVVGAEGPEAAADLVAELGFDRVLTAGRARGGADPVALGQLVRAASGRFGVVAGGGVRSTTVAGLARAGIVEFHASARGRWTGPFGLRTLDPVEARALRAAVDAARGGDA